MGKAVTSGKTGTSMTIEYAKGKSNTKKKKQRKRSASLPKAGPVKVTRADGTVEILAPLKGSVSQVKKKKKS